MIAAILLACRSVRWGSMFTRIMFVRGVIMTVKVAMGLQNISVWSATLISSWIRANVPTSAVPWSIRIKGQAIANGVILRVRSAGDPPNTSAWLAKPTTLSTTMFVTSGHVLGLLTSQYLSRDCVNHVNSGVRSVFPLNFVSSALQATISIKVGVTWTIVLVIFSQY